MTPRSNAARALVGALALFVAATGAGARLPDAAPIAPEDIVAAMTTAAARFEAQDCAGVLALLDPLASRVAPGQQRTAIQLMRLRCLAATGRVGDLAPVQRELAQSAPRDPAVRSFGVMLSVDAGRFGDAADQIRAIATDQPKALALIPGTLWRAVSQRLTESGDVARRGATEVALAQADWQPIDRPDLRDEIAQGAIEALLDKNDVASAQALLPRVEMPELLVGMAMERRYRRLWPAIEARLGRNGGTAVDSFAATRLDGFADAPGDAHARRDAVRAFILLGRFDDAVAIGEQVTIGNGMDEDDVDAVRFEAQAISAAGDRLKAAGRLRALAALDPAATPEAASAVVSLAELLDEAGKPADALAVARDGLVRDGKALSPWGIAWLRRTEVCTLTTLGRGVEAKVAGDVLKAAAADNEAAAIEGLLCAGRSAEAATIAIKTLATAEGASHIADQFQPRGAFWASTPSRLRALWMPLLARKDVRAAFDKSARILPQALWPSAKPRPLPRDASRGYGPTI